MRKTKFDGEYQQVLDELRRAKTTEDFRAVHKKLKIYGDGIPFADRYPRAHVYAAWASIWISAAGIAIGVAGIIIRMIGG